ncbi:MAG: DUF4199 domain-containing protein [Schleiferiaceae bacterium]|jgi:phosphatidylglycerophosphate synthase|nr:DUF4199 domain-containing protein [Schleiferiaceae bacterium]
MNPLVKKYGIKYGGIAISVGILYFLIAYIFNEQLFANWWMGILLLIFNFVMMVMAVVAMKKEQGGFISYKEAVSVFSFSYIVVAIINLVFSLLMFHVVDPGLADRVMEISIEMAVSMSERFGAPEEQIQAQIDQMKEADTYGVYGLFKTAMWGIIIYTVLGLIVAAFMKKDKPVFENTVD